MSIISPKSSAFPSITLGKFELHNLRPGIGGSPLQSLSVENLDHGKVGARHTSDEGIFEWSLEECPKGVDLSSKICRAESAPHWFHALAGVEVSGAVRFFRTGIGFSGPTNIIDLNAQGGSFSFESYMISAFEAEDGSALVIYTVENRQFLSKTQIHNRLFKSQFRNRVIDKNQLLLECGFSTECIEVPESGLNLPIIHLRLSNNLYDGIRAAAEHIAEVNRARVPDVAPTYFCSWYEKHENFTHEDLLRVIHGHQQCNMDFSAIQIDDGYCRGWGNWLLPNEKWPNGMKEAAQVIRANGMKAGIWVAPMTVEAETELWNQHPDWVLKDLSGQPILKMKPKTDANGHTTPGRYALDLSHPEVLQYITHVFTTLREWGFSCFKTDFMDWGYVDSTTVQRHTPGKTSAQCFDEALKSIRAAIGEDAYWLACISYFAPFVGYCDGMRVSSDVGTSWNGGGGNGNDGIGGGTMNVLQETYNDQFFNNVFWANDPDVIFLRDQNTQLNEAETRSLALLSGMLGGTLTLSDFPDTLIKHRLALWNFIHPRNTQKNAEIPYWGRKDEVLYVAVRPLGTGHALFVLNPTETSQWANLRICELIGKETMSTCLWSEDGTGEVVNVDQLNFDLAPHHSVLYWLGESPAPPSIHEI